MSDKLFFVEGISKRFGDRQVLDEVRVSVGPGEVLGLIGPNGVGKTTLFECLAGLLPVNSGTINYLDRSLSLLHRKEALSYLPDAILPWSEQTVKWLLDFFERLYRGAALTIATLSEPLRLKELMKLRIRSLSKGERKRVLLALGLLTPHRLLLLDEPFDGLVLQQTRDVMTLLRRQAEDGRTLLLSIHQLIDAGRVCESAGRQGTTCCGARAGPGSPEVRLVAFSFSPGGVTHCEKMRGRVQQ